MNAYPSAPKTALASVSISTEGARAVPANPVVAWAVETGGSNIGHYAVIDNTSSVDGEVDIYYS